MEPATPSLWTNQEVAAALKKEAVSFKDATGVSIDTRTLQPGDLYVAIRGETHDGHAFVADAFAKGAVAAIVDHPVLTDASYPQLMVDDTLKALSWLGLFARARSKATFVGVTGSVGKTSTKELLRHVLSAFGPTFASPASYNNHWGVPLSLACLPRDSRYGIFEMGMNHRGEIAPLAYLVRPHIGVITTIAEAHIGPLGSRQAIAQEKSDIFSSAPPPSLALLPHDVPEFDDMRHRAKEFGVSKVVSFGKSAAATVRLVDYHPDASGLKGGVSAALGGQKAPYAYTLPQPGEHMAMNSLIALALGDALGLDQRQVIHQLETLPPVAGRGQWHRLPFQDGDILLIDDAYNANLTSMQAGLTVLASAPVQSGGRRLAVLGEMLELGSQAEPHHQQLMAEVLARPIDQVFAVGGPVIEAAFSQSIPLEKAGGYAATAEALLPRVLNTIRPGDIIFVKGSKGSGVSKIVDALVKHKKREG